MSVAVFKRVLTIFCGSKRERTISAILDAVEKITSKAKQEYKYTVLYFNKTGVDKNIRTCVVANNTYYYIVAGNNANVRLPKKFIPSAQNELLISILAMTIPFSDSVAREVRNMFSACSESCKCIRETTERGASYYVIHNGVVLFYLDIVNA